MKWAATLPRPWSRAGKHCAADAEAARKIVKGDSCINNMERDIEHRCMTLLLRQRPGWPGDLRRISTAMGGHRRH